MTIVNDDGHAVAGYEYEPFSDIISAIIEPSKISHFYHHSYIHDQETGLYYLQSRYYDPKVGRFLNADAYTSTGQGILGNNMFAYCNNNPSNYHDQSGQLPVENDEFGPNAMCYDSTSKRTWGPTPWLDQEDTFIYKAIKYLYDDMFSSPQRTTRTILTGISTVTGSLAKMIWPVSPVKAIILTAISVVAGGIAFVIEVEIWEEEQYE